MGTNNGLIGMSAPLSSAIAFIWKEAELLDRKDYAAWSALWLESGRYVVPIDPDATDFEAQLNYAYDDARMRALRIGRLMSGSAMSAVDAAATVRSVSRFVPVSVSDERVEVNSAQILVGYKRQTHTTFVANLSHSILFTPEGPRLEQKVVRLINAADSLSALGFLL
jgi:3-phenylpropionate/cinnamic acid dioxygenase small subunit